MHRHLRIVVSSFKEGKSYDNGNYVVFGKTPVFVHDTLPDNIDLSSILKKLEDEMPWHFAEDLDIIYIGNFDFLTDRDLNALYADSAIYISATQDDADDLYDDWSH